MLTVLLIPLGMQGVPAVDPTWYLAFERKNSIFVSQADGSGMRAIGKGSNPRWSPDGQKLAFYRAGDLWIFDMRSGKAHVLARFETRTTQWYSFDASIDWDPYQPAILCATERDDGITLVPLGAGRPEKILNRWSYWRTCAPRWSPSGRLLAFCRNGDVWLAKRDLVAAKRGSRVEKNEYYDHATRLAALAVFNDVELGASVATPFWADELEWTRDEKRLVFHFQRQGGSGVSEIGYLELSPTEENWDSPAGYAVKKKWILRDVLSPRICPDGRTLSYVSLGSSNDLYLCGWDGKPGRKILSDVWNPCWRPTR